jgi:hypothetical protein
MPGKEMKMFGRMTVDAMLTVGARCEPLAAVKALMEMTRRSEGGEMGRVFGFHPPVRDDPRDAASGTIYALDRKSGVWYWIDLEDSQYGGYTREELEQLLWECNLLSLVERPALLRSGLKWVVKRGQAPMAS